MSRKCVKCKKVHEDLTKYCPTCKEYARVYREANKEDIAVKKAVNSSRFLLRNLRVPCETLDFYGAFRRVKIPEIKC